jgi:hypothetical protein
MSRYCDGVTLKAALKHLDRCAWSKNPTSFAIAARSMPFRMSALAAWGRLARTNRAGVRPKRSRNDWPANTILETPARPRKPDRPRERCSRQKSLEHSILAGLDQRRLAELAGLSVPTVQRMEASEGVVRGTVDSLMRLIVALEECGVELIGEDAVSAEGGRGVRLKKLKS